MGLLSTLQGLLGGTPAPAGSAAPSVDGGRRSSERILKLDKDWLLVPTAAGFFGHAVVSPGGQWVVALNDSDGKGRGGFREAGNGRVLLGDLRADRVAHVLGRYARPMGVAIAASGRYVIHVAGFSSGLQGAMVAIEPDGQEIYRRDLEANIFNVGLSECGRFAAVQTANAPSADGNVLEVHDLTLRKRLFSVPPSSGWADSYSFTVEADGGLLHLLVIHDALGMFRYAPDGRFLDAAAMLQARLEKGEPVTRFCAVRDMFEQDPGPANAGLALSVCDSVLTSSELDASWKASIQRLRGACLESMGQPEDALVAYDAALALNPKVGVKRAADALRRKLGKS